MSTKRKRSSSKERKSTKKPRTSDDHLLEAIKAYLDAKLDKAITDLDAKLDKAITDLDAKLDKAITDLDAKLDKAITDLDAKLDKAITDAKEDKASTDAKLDKAITDLDAKLVDLDVKLKLLLSEAPAVTAKSVAPYLGTPPSVDEVKTGTTATWTVVKDTQDQFWVIGAAHCGFFQRGKLITLPRKVCSLGVESVLFHPELSTENFNHWKYDVLVVKLTSGPQDYDEKSKVVWDKQPSRVVERSSVGGLSTSGYVVVNHITYHEEDGVYYGIDNTGEPGHSGTLMFAHTPDGRIAPFGVYAGVLSRSDKCMRFRSVIVPLNFEKLRERKIGQQHQRSLWVEAFNKGQLVPANFPLTKCVGPVGNAYVSYSDGGERYYGVVMDGCGVLLCGHMQCDTTKRSK